jgi:predicted DNA binding protein
VIRARFRIRLPESAWIAEVSRAFPSASYRLLTGSETETGAIHLGRVVADEPLAAAAAVRDHPAVESYERLETGDDSALAKYTVTDPALYEFVARSSVPPEYPVVVENGRVEFDFTGTRAELDRFRSVLADRGLDHDLLSLVGGDGDGDGRDDAESALTDRQREVLRTALRMGYFEVPRECTLADVAAEFDVDKSTVSGVLRRGEGRILKRALTGIEER